MNEGYEGREGSAMDETPDAEPIHTGEDKEGTAKTRSYGAAKRGRPMGDKGTEEVSVEPIVDMGLTGFLNEQKLLKKNALLPISTVMPFDIRDKGSDKNKIVTFAQSMQEGIIFPNIVVMQDDDGTLRMADGNHRIQAAALAGKDMIRADIYRGGIDECIDVGLGANMHGQSLKPQDIVKAITMKLGKDWKIEDINLSDLSRKVGISRITLRKHFNMAKTGFAGMANKIKMPKSDIERARELADKVVRMVGEGNLQVIHFVFQSLPPNARKDILETLQGKPLDVVANI